MLPSGHAGIITAVIQQLGEKNTHNTITWSILAQNNGVDLPTEGFQEASQRRITLHTKMHKQNRASENT